MAESAERYELTDIEDEMSASYVEYAMYTIVDRALPDARDGLKPSQRRILIAMNDLNLSPGGAHRKCQKICGDTSGNYHPAGGEIVYPTLVRMAQHFNARYPLIDGQGNFGTVDGHPPAQARYTEARLSPLAVEMLQDIDKETVDTQPNYDETRQEPVVLPARFPNLLCNGSAGIAVALATNMPPHNLTEVCDALIYLVDNPDASIKLLMRRITGPDFPTGGMILGLKGIQDAYETGRGSITMQARTAIEPMSGGRNAILITELPYQVNKTTLLQQIAKLVQNRRVRDIATVRDETDRKGMRIVLELRRDANANVVLNQLYKHTALRTNFSVNALALVDRVPRTLTLRHLLQQYIDHRKEVILRRTAYLLQRAEEREHIVTGLIIASDHIDEIIATIRRSKDRPTARQRLQENFKLSERQAQAVIEMVLGQLTGLDQARLRDELRDLRQQIKELKAILADIQMVLDIIKTDLRELKRKLGDERRTRIVPDEADDIDIEDLIAEEELVITVTRDGYVKRLPLDTYRVQHRGGKGVIALTKKEEDTIEHLFVATTHHLILCFTDQGRVYRLKAYEVPSASRQARGTAIVNLANVEPGEHITALVPVRSFDQGGYLLMVTERGIVKKSELAAYDTQLRARGLIAINLDKGDSLRWVKCSDGKQDVLIATQQGKCIRFAETAARPIGRSARGVIGIRMKRGDKVVGMDIVDPKDKRCLLVVTQKGLGKRTALKEYARKGRGTQGVKTVNITKKNGPVVGGLVVDADDELMALASDGNLIRMPVAGIRQTGRAAQGVKLVALSDNATVRAAARVLQQAVNGDA